MFDDANGGQGGPDPILANGPGTGGSYEHKQFDNGMNNAVGQPGGAYAAQARIVGNSIEVAVFRPFLATLQGTIITAAFRPYAARGTIVNGDIYGTLISLESTGGDLTVGATSDIEAGHFSAGAAVRLYAYGDLTITAGASVVSLSDMMIGVTDAGGTLYIGGSVYAFGAGSNGTANLIYS